MHVFNNYLVKVCYWCRYMSKKEKNTLDILVGENKYSLFTKKTKDGIIIGPHTEGNKLHLTAYNKFSNGGKLSIHSSDYSKEKTRDKTFVETSDPLKFFSDLESSFRAVLLSDEVVTGDLFELNGAIGSGALELTSLKDNPAAILDLFPFMENIKQKVKSKDEIPDKSKPVAWEDISKHSLLSNLDGDLLLVFNSKVFRINPDQVSKSFEIINNTFGAGEVTKWLGVNTES